MSVIARGRLVRAMLYPFVVLDQTLSKAGTVFLIHFACFRACRLA